MLIEDPSWMKPRRQAAAREAALAALHFLHPPVSQIIQRVRDEEEERFRRCRGTLQTWSEPDVTNLDRAVIRLDAHQRGDTFGPIARAWPDSEEERIFAGGLSIQVSTELPFRGKGPVRQILPNPLPFRVAVAGRVEGGGMGVRIERLDERVGTLSGRGAEMGPGR